MKKLKLLFALFVVSALFAVPAAQGAFWNWTHVYVRNNTNCEFVRGTIKKKSIVFGGPEQVRNVKVTVKNKVVILPYSRRRIFSIPRRHAGIIANTLFLFPLGTGALSIMKSLTSSEEEPFTEVTTSIYAKKNPKNRMGVKLVSTGRKGSAGQLSWISKQSTNQLGGPFKVSYDWYPRIGLQLYKNLFITIDPLDPNECKKEDKE